MLRLPSDKRANGYSEVRFQQVDSAIRSVAVSANHRFVLAGLDSGSIVVFNVDFNRWHYEYKTRYQAQKWVLPRAATVSDLISATSTVMRPARLHVVSSFRTCRCNLWCRPHRICSHLFRTVIGFPRLSPLLHLFVFVTCSRRDTFYERPFVVAL